MKVYPFVEAEVDGVAEHEAEPVPALALRHLCFRITA